MTARLGHDRIAPGDADHVPARAGVLEAEWTLPMTALMQSER
jgi:hypothetical protein